MTLSLAAVFIPMLFMGGILGRLFREFAVTICAAILISGMVSIIADADAVQPLSAARRATQRHGLFYRATERFFDGMLHVYGVSLRWVLRHRPVMLAVFFLVLGATALPVRHRAQGLHPGARTTIRFT